MSLMLSPVALAVSEMETNTSRKKFASLWEENIIFLFPSFLVM